MTRFSRLCRSAGLLLLTTGGWLFPSHANAADNPVFSGSSQRLVKAAAVACLEARCASVSENTPRGEIPVVFDFHIDEMLESSATFIDYQPATESRAGYFFFAKKQPGPLKILGDAALRLVDAHVDRGTISYMLFSPADDESSVDGNTVATERETINGVSVQQSLQFMDADEAQNIIGRPITIRERTIAAATNSAELQDFIIRAPERIGVDFDFTIDAAVPETLPVELPTFAFTTRSERIHYWSLLAHLSAFETVKTFYPEATLLGGIKRLPRIIIIEEEEDLLLGVGVQALETDVQPLLEPELLAVNDAAPLENPAAEFIQRLPADDDAPAENPELETSAARVVSPTMSPDEYLAAFSHRILEQQESHELVMPVAHEEPIQKVIPSPLQALGDQVTICDSHAPNCHGFTIQFAPQLQPMPVAEVEAFDGPAQITLHDGPNAPGQGFVWPAQPAAHNESLDELADRLEREFLARAVSGQIQIPAECSACPAVDKEASCKESACKEGAVCKSGSCSPCQPALSTCPTANCPTYKCPPCHCQPNSCKAIECQPGSLGLAECIACPTGTPGGECCPTPSAAKSAVLPAFPPRSLWTLPTPAVMINPYAQSTLTAVPGAGVELPRDIDFYGRSGMEVPAGSPTCGNQVYPGPTTFAAPQPPMAAAQSQLAMSPQHACSVWTPAMACAAPGVCHVTPTLTPPAPNKTPVSGEALETHREISRTLEQLAERCEAQGLYTQADELRGQAQEFRMRARVIHGHLAALPLPPTFGQLPQPAYGPMPPQLYDQLAPAAYGPMPYLGPSMYPGHAAPVLAPPPAPIPATHSQPLPIAQPIMVPRY